MKEYKLNTINDFNNVIDYLNEMLYFVQKTRYGNGMKEPYHKMNINSIRHSRIIAAQHMFIMNILSLPLKNVDDKQTNRTYQLIERNENGQFTGSLKTEISVQELIEIRNCLAHGDFCNCVSEPFFDKSVNGEVVEYYIKVKVNNKELRISLNQEDPILALYKILYKTSINPDKTIIYTFMNDLDFFDKESASKELERIHKLEITGKKLEFTRSNIYEISDEISEKYSVPPDEIYETIHDVFNSYGYNHYDYMEHSIDDRKQFILRYLDYLGYKNINKLSPQSKQSLLLKLIKYADENYILPDSNIHAKNLLFLYDSQPPKLQNDFVRINEDRDNDRIAETFFIPFAYSGLLITLSQYTFGYLRDVNSSENDDLSFLYKDINLDAIDKDFTKKNGIYSNRYLKSTENLFKKIIDPQKEINNNKKMLENLKKRLSSETDVQKKNSIQKEIDTINKKIREYQIIIDNYGNNSFIDYSTFFKRMRNSLDHKYYSFDFDKALLTGNMEDIKIKFWDKRRATDTNNVFELNLTAKELKTIIKNFQININECISLLKENESYDKLYEEITLDTANRDRMFEKAFSVFDLLPIEEKENDKQEVTPEDIYLADQDKTISQEDINSVSNIFKKLFNKVYNKFLKKGDRNE